MKVSIITVCYNAENQIKRTIDSVLIQGFQNFEYIIIDGKSTDKTLKIIKKYTLDFKKKDIDFKIISEPDKGIYDAMNKGIKNATGVWINFMNAGDQFYSSNVLYNIFTKNYNLDDKVLVYGFKYQNNKAIYPKEIDVLKNGIMLGNHQSMFFNKTIIKEDLIFDLKYPIYGDYELVNRLYLKYGERNFEYINIPIAIYEGRGVSEKTSYQKRKDKYLILIKHYGFLGLLKGVLFKLTKLK